MVFLALIILNSLSNKAMMTAIAKYKAQGCDEDEAKIKAFQERVNG